MAAPIRMQGAALLPGAPVPLFRPRMLRGGADVSFGPQYDVSRDPRFLVNTVANETTLTPITLIPNRNQKASAASLDLASSRKGVGKRGFGQLAKSMK
jgi:hypothetical protein